MTGTDWRRQGAVHFLSGRDREAAMAFEKALAMTPKDPDSLSSLALVRLRQGRLEAAAAAFKAALRLRPDNAGTLVNLGNLEVRRRNHSAAEACYRRALAVEPDCPEAWNNLGNICQVDGRMDQAQKCYQKAMQIDSGYPSAANNLGNLYQKKARFEAAEGCYRRALTVNPQDPEVLSNLAQCLRSQGRLAEALCAVEKVLEKKPECAEAHNHRGLILQDQGCIGEAMAAFDEAISLSPKDPLVHSNRLFAMHYDPHATSADHLRAASKWWERHGAGADTQPMFQNDPDPFRRLRIGFVSGDFRSHSVAFFLMPLFQHLDRQRIEVYAYSEVGNPDDITGRFRKLSQGWYSTVGRDAAMVAEKVRSDEIDILIDLAGHTACNRLDVFGLRPAPIQMTWLGYPGPTGSPVIDYRITDAIADPPGQSDAWYSERLIRLPTGFICYSPPGDAASVEKTPVCENGHITFASFNTRPKLNPRVIETWATLLNRVPGSLLLIKCKQLADAGTCQRLQQQFAHRGVPSERLHLMPKVPDTKGHLSVYHQVDIGLDPFPYNGTTTTCEALWMGVPVVTLCGDRHSGRVGASILTHLGLENLAAQNETDYVKRAQALALDRQRLMHLRRTLRQHMMGSPLCDGPAFARVFEGVLRKTWIDWCRDQMPAMGNRGFSANGSGKAC